MALVDLAALAVDDTFKSKVQIAICSAALNVMGEDPTNSNRQDEKRSRLAEAVLSDGGESKVSAFAFAAASFGTLTGASPDSDIQFVINSIWSDMAGVTGSEL